MQPTRGSGAPARARLRSRRRLCCLPAPAPATKTRGPQPAAPSWGGDIAGQDPGGSSTSAPAAGPWASAVAHDAPGSSLRLESGKTHLGRAKAAPRCPESTHLSVPSPQRRKFPRPAPTNRLWAHSHLPLVLSVLSSNHDPPGCKDCRSLLTTSSLILAVSTPARCCFPRQCSAQHPSGAEPSSSTVEGVGGSLLPLKAHFSRGIFRSGLILDFPG